LSIRKITAGTLSSNIGMQKIMEKSGMMLEGRKIRQEIVEGIEEDILFYAKFKP
jgi:RimJ/RimL family protein N-acetyltransferase